MPMQGGRTWIIVTRLLELSQKLREVRERLGSQNNGGIVPNFKMQSGREVKVRSKEGIQIYKKRTTTGGKGRKPILRKGRCPSVYEDSMEMRSS